MLGAGSWYLVRSPMFPESKSTDTHGRVSIWETTYLRTNPWAGEWAVRHFCFWLSLWLLSPAHYRAAVRKPGVWGSGCCCLRKQVPSHHRGGEAEGGRQAAWLPLNEGPWTLCFT